MSQVYDEPIVVRLTQPVGPYPVGTEFGFKDVADAIRALGSSAYFTVVRTQDGDPIPPPTPEDLTEAERQAQERARAMQLVRRGDIDAITPGPGEFIVGSASGPQRVAFDGTTSTYTPLDIWPGFDASGADAGSWSALAYTDYIAGLDASLSGPLNSGAVQKADLGVASDGTSHVYAYDAGDGPVEVLLIAGTHGAEIMGQYAAMRWFQQFVTSNDASCQQLRNALRVTFIPVLNPAAYRQGRTNANGVDINRNSDLYWARNSGTDPSDPYYKGAAPVDQPETQMIVDLLASRDYRVVFDCHNYNDDGNTASFNLPGGHLLGPRSLGAEMVGVWKAVYGREIATSWLTEHYTQPTLFEYANYVIRHQRGHAWSGAILLECSQNLFGSSGPNGGSLMTRAAVRAYAGMIHTYLLLFLGRNGQATSEPYSYTYQAYQGSHITPANNDKAYMTLSHSFGINVVNTDTFLVPVAYGPALVSVAVTGYLSSAGGISRTTMGIEIDGVSRSFWQTSVSTTANSGDANPYSVSAVVRVPEVSNVTIPTVRFYYDVITGTLPSIRQTNMQITVSPDTLDRPAPRINTV